MRQGLALRFPDQDPDSMSPILPPAAQRVGKVMAFGPNGELSVGGPGGYVGQIETMRDEAVAARNAAESAEDSAVAAQVAAEAAAASVPVDAGTRLTTAESSISTLEGDMTVAEGAIGIAQASITSML